MPLPRTALMPRLRGCLLALGLTLGAVGAAAAADAGARPPAAVQDYVLGGGDAIKITVFQNPDLSLQTRVSENGSITFPLIGAVNVGGVSTAVAEQRIAAKLKDGGFLVDPQVTVLLEQVHGNQVAALGQFNRPGRYPIESTQMRLSDLIAQAGGIAPTGADTVILTGMREGKAIWREIDVGGMFTRNRLDDDVVLKAGDTVFVDRYPVFYIYGEVQKPGAYRVERNMTLVQALAAGGGLTPRGTQRGLRVKRKDARGQMMEMKPALEDPVQSEDVIYVQESLF